MRDLADVSMKAQPNERARSSPSAVSHLVSMVCTGNGGELEGIWGVTSDKERADLFLTPAVRRLDHICYRR